MSKKYVGYGIVRHKCLILEPKLSYNMNKNLTLTFLLLLWGQITYVFFRHYVAFFKNKLKHIPFLQHIATQNT